MLTKIVSALSATGYPYAHHAWSKQPSGTYLVYAEDSATHSFADNVVSGQVLEGTIDLFTKDDTDTPRTTVQDKLDLNEVNYYLNSIQYEQDTGLIHYEWVFTDG